MITIIIPAYNAEFYIFDTLKSVVDTFKGSCIPYEVLIINDGSTDNTKEIVESFINTTDIIIKLFNTENLGVSSARNLGIDKAKFDYLYFLDSDDLLDSNFIESFSFFSNSPDIIEGRIAVFDHKDIYKTQIKSIREPSKHSEQNFISVIKGKIWLLSSRIINRKAIGNIRFNNNIRFCEDMDFLIRVYKNSKNVISSDFIFYRYRVHSNSVTSFYKKYFLTDLLFIYANVRNCLNEKERLYLTVHMYEMISKFARNMDVSIFCGSQIAKDLLEYSFKFNTKTKHLTYYILVKSFSYYAFIVRNVTIAKKILTNSFYSK